LPAGYRGWNYGGFWNLGDYAIFYSSTEPYNGWAWSRHLGGGSQVSRMLADGNEGYSVRCVKGPDEPNLIFPINKSFIHDSTTTFDWSDVADATIYHLMVDDDSTFNNPEILETSLQTSEYLPSISFVQGTYYWRVRCQDATGTWGGWSEISTFTIRFLETSTLMDIDGNTYITVKIGSQWWMMENLKVTHYRNGDPIPNVTPDTEWAWVTSGAYCAWDNDESHVGTFGLLYNWYAVEDSRGLSPEGWHVPTEEEWQTLVNYLDAGAGGKLKEVGTNHWSAPNIGATNESGFTALPGGYRHSNSGAFGELYDSAYFWSTKEVTSLASWSLSLLASGSWVRSDSNDKQSGFSVRCIKD